MEDITQNTDPTAELIKDFYKKNAPDKVSALTDEAISTIKNTYGDDTDGLIKDLYTKYAPDKVSKLTPDVLVNIRNTYGFAEKKNPIGNGSEPIGTVGGGEVQYTEPIPTSDYALGADEPKPKLPVQPEPMKVKYEFYTKGDKYFKKEIGTDREQPITKATYDFEQKRGVKEGRLQDQFTKAIKSFDGKLNIPLGGNDYMGEEEASKLYSKPYTDEERLNAERVIAPKKELYEKSNELSESGDHIGALNLALEGLKQDPKNRLFKFQAAYNLQQTGDDTEAEKIYKELLSNPDPKSKIQPDVLHANLAAIYSKQKNYKQSIIEADKAIALNPDLHGAYFQKAYALGKTGKKEEEKKVWNIAKEIETLNLPQPYTIGESPDEMRMAADAKALSDLFHPGENPDATRGEKILGWLVNPIGNIATHTGEGIKGGAEKAAEGIKDIGIGLLTGTGTSTGVLKAANGIASVVFSGAMASSPVGAGFLFSNDAIPEVMETVMAPATKILQAAGSDPAGWDSEFAKESVATVDLIASMLLFAKAHGMGGEKSPAQKIGQKISRREKLTPEETAYAIKLLENPERAVSLFKQAGEALSSMPKGLSRVQKMGILPKMIEINNLKAENETLDPLFQKINKEKITQLEKDIQFIVESATKKGAESIAAKPIKFNIGDDIEIGDGKKGRVVKIDGNRMFVADLNAEGKPITHRGIIDSKGMVEEAGYKGNWYQEKSLQDRFIKLLAEKVALAEKPLTDFEYKFMLDNNELMESEINKVKVKADDVIELPKGEKPTYTLDGKEIDRESFESAMLEPEFIEKAKAGDINFEIKNDKELQDKVNDMLNAQEGAEVNAKEEVAKKPTFENVPIYTRTPEQVEFAKNEVFNNLNKLEVGSVIENSDGEIKVITEKSTDRKGNQLIGVVTYERQADGSLRQMTNPVWASKSSDGKIKLDYNPHQTGTNAKGERVTVTDQITDKKIDLSKENIFTEDKNGNIIQINKAEPNEKAKTEEAEVLEEVKPTTEESGGGDLDGTKELNYIKQYLPDLFKNISNKGQLEDVITFVKENIRKDKKLTNTKELEEAAVMWLNKTKYPEKFKTPQPIKEPPKPLEEVKVEPSSPQQKPTEVVKPQEAKAVVEEIKSKPLTHAVGVKMGMNEMEGTFLSTEPTNRYADRAKRVVSAEVKIENPYVLKDANEIITLRNEALPTAIEKYIEANKEDLTPKQIEQLKSAKSFDADVLESAMQNGLDKLIAKEVTDNLKAKGHDAAYLPESKGEGMLIVFDKNNVKFDDSGDGGGGTPEVKINIGTPEYKSGKNQIKGRTITKTIPNGEKIKGTYKVVSADDVIASHNEKTFSQSENFPKRPDGKTVNDRDYEQDKSAQGQVIDIAQRLDDRAISKTPTVSKDGIVLDGNNRTMSRKLAAKNGTDGKYLEALKEQAELYGIEPEAIDNIKNPMLVFEAESNMPYTTETFKKFNVNELKEKSPIDKAIEISKTITDRARNILFSIYEDSQRASDITSSPKKVKELIDLFEREGLIQSGEMPRYFNKEKLTATKEGVAFIENVLLGSALKEDIIRTLDADGMGDIRLKVLSGITQLVKNSSLKENSLINELEGAIEIHNEAKATGQSPTDYINQMDLFKAKDIDIPTMAMAIMLDQKGFKTWLNDYNNRVGKLEVDFDSPDGKIATKLNITDEALQVKLKNYDKVRANVKDNAKGGENKVEPDGGQANKKDAEISGGEKPKAAAEIIKEIDDAIKPPKAEVKADKGEVDAYEKNLKEFAEKLKKKINPSKDPTDTKSGTGFTDDQIIDFIVDAIIEARRLGKKVLEHIRQTDIYREFSDKEAKRAEKIMQDHFHKEVGLSGIKKALLSDEIIEKANIDRISDKEMQSLGKELIETGEINPREIIEEIAGGSPRALQPKEVVSLIYHKVTLDKSLDKINEQIAEGYKNKEDVSELIAKRAILENQIMDYNIMSAITAQQQSLAFRLRKGLRDREYNLQAQINKYKANNEGKIPADVEAKFRDLDAKLKEVDAELAKERERREKAESELAEFNIKAEIERGQKPKSYTQRSKEIADMVRKLKNKPLELRDENGNVIDIYARGVTWNDIVENIAKSIEKSGEIADGINEYLKNAKWYNNLTEKGKETVRKQLEDHFAIKESKQPKTPHFDSNNEIVIPKSFLKSLIEKGIDKIEDWTTAAYEILKEDNPDITETQVRDAITGYGKKVNLTKDAIEIKIQEQKSIGRLLSAYEDVTKNLQNPKRTGVQRRQLIERERELAKKIREAMKDLPQDEADIQAKWKSLLDKRKTQLRNEIESIERQITEGRDEAKNKGVKYDEETNDLVKVRDAKKKQLDELYPTERKTMSPEERVNRAMGSLQREIDVLDDALDKGILERAKRIVTKTPETPELKAKRAERDAKKKILEDLRKEAGILQKEKMQYLENLRQKQISELKERLATGNFAKGRYDKNGKFIPAQPKQELVPSDKLSKLEAEKARLQEEFEKEQYKAELKNQTFSQKGRSIAVEVFGLTRIIAGIDLSSIGVQGVMRTITRPKQAARATVEMFKQLASEKRYEEFISKIKQTDLYYKIHKSGGYISEAHAKQIAREEAFNSGWVNHIYDFIGKYTLGLVSKKAFDVWKKANPYKATQRAFEGYLNMMRLQAFDEYFTLLEKEGYTLQNAPNEFKGVASWINNATGRGKLPGKLDLASDVLTIGIFSPRKVAANFTVLNPFYYASLYRKSPVMAKQAMKNMAQFMGVVGTTLFLYDAYKKANDEEGEVEWNPRSSHFLQMKTKDGKYVDILAGMGQVLALYGKIITGERKLNSGEIEELGEKFGTPTEIDIAWEFFESKASPTVGELIRLIESRKEKYTGKRISKYGEEMTPMSEFKRLTLPIWMQGVEELHKEGDPLVNAGLQFLTLIGTNVRAPKDTKEKEEKKMLLDMFEEFEKSKESEKEEDKPKEKKEPLSEEQIRRMARKYNIKVPRGFEVKKKKSKYMDELR